MCLRKSTRGKKLSLMKNQKKNLFIPGLIVTMKYPLKKITGRKNEIIIHQQGKNRKNINLKSADGAEAEVDQDLLLKLRKANVTKKIKNLNITKVRKKIRRLKVEINIIIS